MPSRRELIRMTDEEVEQFLDGRHTMNVATIGPGDRIHLVAMWYGFLEGAPAFWTFAKSQKILNLRRDSRITALVEDGEQYEELRGVELVGTGTVVEDRERIMALGRSVFDRYTGPYTDEMAPVLEATGAKRLVVKIEVESVVSWDHRKLGGTY
jgi:PPOX class probable F420-dependent enzyme